MRYPKDPITFVNPVTQHGLILSAVLVYGAPVQAQTLKDIVVSASRAEQRSFDAPAAVQSIDQDTIRGAGPQVNLSESLNRVAGLTILNRQNYAQDLQLSIRGFGARSAFGIRGIRLLIDGIPATTPDGQGQGSSVSLTSTDRMEVLRGPLAQLYGNSSGGVLQAFTRDVPDEPEFGAQYYVGSFGMHRSDWQYAGKVGSGLGLIADYSTFDTSGFRANSNAERKQFNAKLSFETQANTKVNVILNHFNMPTAQDPLGLTAAQMAANRESAGTNAIARNVRKIVSQNQVGTSITHPLDTQAQLTGRLYYGNRDNLQYQAGVAGTATALGGWVGLSRDYYGIGLQYNGQSALTGMPIRWAAGVEFDRSQERRQGGAAALGQKTNLGRNEVNTADNTDLFAQATVSVNDHLSVVGGARHSTVKLTSDDEFLADGNGSGSITYQATNPVLGLTWHALESLNIYANWGRGFETPTLAEMAYNGAGVPAFNTALNAASSRHTEIGLKWTPTPQSRLDFTVYQIETSDEIVVASSVGGNSTFKNAPGTQRKGWELAGSAMLSPNWKGTLSASQIEATYSKTFTTISGAPPAATTVSAGNNIPGIPQTSLFAEVLWTNQQPVKRNSAVVLGTQLGLEYLQSGRLFANDTNTVLANAYSTWAFKASHGFAVGKGSLSAYTRVDNPTDEKYVGSVIVNQNNAQFFEPAPGLNWTIGLRMVLPL